MTVEPARAGDLPAIRALLDAGGLPADDLTGAQLGHFFVLRDGTALRGVAGLEPHGDEALLRSVVVRAADRGQGLAARLVEAAERRAGELGLRRLHLLTTGAADYFATRGYRTIARNQLPEVLQGSRQAAELCPATAVCMRRDLVRD